MEGCKGGGEVRRVHVLYFLSHNGAIEHPHLIRVHHLHCNGVYLRDVKRWLADLRGKDMPESFSWSYKRRYKSGYVWQDLMDDELITPISDNEYVLKGSELSSKTHLPRGSMASDEEAKDSPASKTSQKSIHAETDKSDQGSPGSLLLPPPISSSDVSDESTEDASIIKIDSWKQQSKQEDGEKQKEYEAKEECTSVPSKKNKYYSRSGRRTSKLFLNLFKCSGDETKDMALMTMQRQKTYQTISGGSSKRTTMPKTQRSVADDLR